MSARRRFSAVWLATTVTALLLVSCPPSASAAPPQGDPCRSDADCDDENPCTQDGCRKAPARFLPGPEWTGLCQHRPSSPGAACDDGDACTEGDACRAGECRPGDPVVCDDGVGCTADSCDPATGCVYAADDGACPEGTCLEGYCDPTAGCQTRPRDCDDTNPCTRDRCIELLGTGCIHLPVSCDDGVDCTLDSCDPGTGECVHAPDHGACLGFPPCTVGQCDPTNGCEIHARCRDANPCTTDSCDWITGRCSYTPVECDDDNACTADACDRDTGECMHTQVADGSSCDDGNVCTVADRCLAGACSPGAPRGCGDGDPCTSDACLPFPGGGCRHFPVLCSDGDRCTVDACDSAAGGCVFTPVGCDDGVDCTVDSCDSATGACMHTPDAGLCPENGCRERFCDSAAGCQLGPIDCDDGDPCTHDACTLTGGGWACSSRPVECDDGVDCTVDSCDPTTGACVHAPAPDGARCDDGDVCTVDDVCRAGDCAAGPPRDCDDGNLCTIDGCTESAGGCVHVPTLCDVPDDCLDGWCDPSTGACVRSPVPDGRSCSDRDECTVDDTCLGGACAGGPPRDCDDGDACTADECNRFLGCRHAALSCDDGANCTADSCDPARGCVVTPVDCDDGDACTEDLCWEPTGQCYHERTRCEDGVFCTVDACDPATGACVHTPDDGRCSSLPCQAGYCDPTLGCRFRPVDCDDGDPCTVDSCDEAAEGCVQEPVDCDDGNECTADACDPETGECVHPSAPDGAACDDANDCTVGDVCAGGACAGSALASCDDGNVCTDDGCDPATGCVHTPNGAPCDDSDLCTLGDTCLGGACAGAQRNCDDFNPCTEDSCDPAVGCVHAPVAAPCDDGDACTVGDACVDGVCGGAPASCDDGNPCTDDVCHPATGCANEPNAGRCDDGSECTTFDTCADGVCEGGPPLDCDDGNPCSDDGCDNETGCFQRFNTNPCDDGDPCTELDECRDGACVGSGPRVCDDGNPCTDDACDPATGCASAPNTAPCDDGDACTTGDGCVAGACASGPPLSCYDANPCTDDACDPATGCTFPPNLAPCDDGDPCTTTDICAEGVCQGGPPPDCDDGDACTDDACAPGGGCANTPNAAPCDDGDACTVLDACSGGACAGLLRDCDDDNDCTDDTCVPASGCVYAANTAPCDDSNACTTGDACAGGACRGTPFACDDGNECTADACDTATGCAFAPVDGGTTTCGVGECFRTVTRCVGGVLQPCVPGAPASEVCNGADDDCDGAIDEGDPCGFLLPMLGLSADDEGAAAWWADGAGPEPYRQGHWVPERFWSCVTFAYPFLASPDYGGGAIIDPASPGAAHGTLPLIGLTRFQAALAAGGYAEGDFRFRFGLMDLGADVEGVDWWMAGDVETRIYRGGTITFTLDGDDIVQAAMPRLRLDVDFRGPSNCYDDAINAWSDPVDRAALGDVSADAPPAAQAVADAFLRDVEDAGSFRIIMRSLQPAGQLEYVAQGRHGAFFDIPSLVLVGPQSACEYVPAICDDGDPCTTDTCVQGAGCVNEPVDCDDGDACTDDACRPGVGDCVSTPVPCDDGDACTDNRCDPTAGCTATPTPCGDADACTVDSCDPATGCRSDPVSCDDGDPCTVDACDPVLGCQYVADDCDDGNPCTDGVCQPDVGCVYADVAGPCEDGYPCTEGDVCVAGACVGGPNVCDCTIDADCDDGDPCTDEVCTLTTGCVWTLVSCVERVSVSSAGGEGNSVSFAPSLAADGRFVAFESAASTLVPGFASWQIYLRDRWLGTTVVLSALPTGGRDPYRHENPVLSADGRFVAWWGGSPAMTPATPNCAGVYVRDLELGATECVAIPLDGAAPNGSTTDPPAISADGRFVAFVSSDTNLVPGDTNGWDDVFVFDRQTRTTERVSVATDGSQGNGYANFAPAISADGRFVAFDTSSSNLVPGDTNGYPDLFVRDRLAGTTTRVNVLPDGTQTDHLRTYYPALSADGRIVAFLTWASTLDPADTNDVSDVYVHDRVTGETTWVSTPWGGGVPDYGRCWGLSISADGRYLATASGRTDLVPGDANGRPDVFVFDRLTGATALVAPTFDGASYSTGFPALSADGRFIGVPSDATDLVPGDTNGQIDVFVLTNPLLY